MTHHSNIELSLIGQIEIYAKFFPKSESVSYICLACYDVRQNETDV